MIFNPRSFSDWFAVVFVAVILFLFVGTQLARFPETQARTHTHGTKGELKTIEQTLSEMIQAGHPLPPLEPLSASIDVDKLKKRNGESLRSFGSAGNFAGHADVFSPKGKGPFAAETSGTLYVMYSTGPDEIYDLQPDVLKTGLREQSALPLSPYTYDPTNGSFSAGDIFMTNLPATASTSDIHSAARAK